MRFIGAVCLLAGAVLADTEIDTLVGEIRLGKYPEFDTERISADPVKARRVCEAAALKSHVAAPVGRGIDALMRASAGMERLTFDARLLEITLAMVSEHPGDHDAALAIAHSQFYGLRKKAARRAPTETTRWIDVANRYEDLHTKRPDGGRPLECAVRLLGVGRRAPGVDAGALVARMRALAAAGAKTYPETGAFRLGVLDADLYELPGLVATGRAEARDRLRALLAGLKELVDARSGPEAIAAYNEAVTCAHDHGRLGVRADYWTTARVLGGSIVTDAPAVTWRRGGIGSLQQFDASGRLLRTLYVGSYRHDRNHRLGDRVFPGTNVKAIAAVALARAQQIVLAAREPRVRGIRLNRHCPGAKGFAYEAEDRDGRRRRVHGYAWKGKRKKRTYTLLVVEEPEARADDPEADQVLGTVREHPGRVLHHK